MIIYEISRLEGKAGKAEKATEISDAMIVNQSPYKHSMHYRIDNKNEFPPKTTMSQNAASWRRHIRRLDLGPDWRMFD